MTLGRADLSLRTRFLRSLPLAAVLALALGFAIAGPKPAGQEPGKASLATPESPAPSASSPVAARSDGDREAEAGALEAEREREEQAREAREREEEQGGGDADVPRFVKGDVDKLRYMQGREGWVAMMRGLDTARPDSRAKAIRQMDEQEKAQALLRSGAPSDAPAAVSPWMFVGPNPIPNGQTSGFVAAVSGRVSAIAVDPTDANVVWAGAAGGGVFRSLDGGTTWTAVLDSALVSAIGAIAIAPSDPTIVYVGTGEAGGSADSFIGVGVYRITSAKSVTPLVEGPFNQDAVPADVMTGRSVSKILVHPTDPATIFVTLASGVGGNPGSQTGFVFPPRGLFRSTNALDASPVFTKLTVNPTSNVPMYDAVFEPGNPNNLLLTINSATEGGVWRTTNALDPVPANVTFTRTLALSTPAPAAGVRAELGINKVGATVTVVVASGETTPIGSSCTAAAQGGVRISTDGGVTWSAAPLQSAGGFCNAQCFYDIFVALDPGDASKIYLGGSADSGSANPCRGSVSLRSTDGGTTFTRNSNGLHADSHAVAVAPTNTAIIYTGNDGGIFKSTDSGATWTSLNNLFFSATQFQSIAVHPRDAKFTIGGTQDNGTNGMNSAGVWNRVDFGDGGYALIDQNAYDTTAMTMYHTYFNQANSIIGFGRVILPGDTATEGAWTFLGFNGVPNGIVNQNVLFYAPMALGPGNPNTLYFAGDRLYRSTDRGTNMAQVSQQFAGFIVTTIGVSPQDDSFRLVGRNDGKIFGTTTGGNPLLDLSPAAAPARIVNRVTFDPNDKNIAYATYGGFALPAGQHVWKNTNLSGGAGNWVASGLGIPDMPVNSIVVDPLDSNRVYAATDIGVYGSSDAGATWLPVGSGLPRVAVFDLAIQNQSRTLRIATHGRGMWEYQIPGAVTPVTMVGFVSSSTAILGGNADPYLEPSEDGSLTINLTNAATATGTATAVSATITTSTPGITITSGTSAYADLAPGASGANLMPLTFHVGSNVLCGTVINLTVTVNYTGDASSPRVFTIRVPTGAPTGTASDTAYAGAPVFIPDAPAPAVTATQTVSGVIGAISKITFSIDGTSCNTTPGSTTVGLDHTFVGDLSINLTSPAGTTIRLTTVGGNSGVNFCNTVFDDAAGTAWLSATGAQAPFTGSFRPVDALSAFAGENPNGTWTVTMQDGGGGDTGTLRAFSIHVTPAFCLLPVKLLSIDDVAVMEGSSGSANAVFTVTLAPASAQTVTVSAQTSNLSATAGSDYTAVGPTTLTFAPGETTKTFMVPVLGDTVLESDETFQVTLSSPTNATISDASGVGTITNDDGAPPSRVFVSASGSDANVCSTQTTPCRNLAAAIGQVAIDGEVIVLAPGEYDTAPILVGKGVKITSPSGTVAFVRQPITVNAPGGRVALRGLSLKGAGALSAVTLVSADSLSIEETSFDSWSRGLDLANVAAASVSVTNSVFASNATAVRDAGAAGTSVSVSETRFDRNATGLDVTAGAFVVRNSLFSASTGAAIQVGGGSADVRQSQLWGNGTGLLTSTGGTARISGSQVFGNTVGLSAGAGSTLGSSGTNAVRGNATDTTGTITSVPEQ